MLVRAGVDWLGFPLRLSYHKEDVPDDEAAAIIRTLEPPTVAVLITYLNKAADILDLCGKLGTRSVQLHGDVRVDELKLLRAEDRGILLVKSLIVTGENLRELEGQVAELSPYVDAFITDTFDPESGARGATGKTHDWRISRRLVEVSPKPVILAGGLTPDNVALAIRDVRPAGVDAHTGVEDANGDKSEDLARRFVGEARQAFSGLRPVA